MVIFQENIYKRDFLPFSTKIYFREKVLKETSYKDRFMGKVLKSLVFFFNKDIEISKQSVIKQKSILLFSTRIWSFQSKRSFIQTIKEQCMLIPGVVCEYIQMYSYWFRPWLLSQPDFEEEQFEEEDFNNVDANQGASQSTACRVGN